MSKGRLLVTGGSGFIGTNAIEHVRRLGWAATNFDVVAPRNPAQMDAWKRVDLLDRSALIEESGRVRPDAVLHLAARTDIDDREGLAGYAANVDGVRNLLDAVRATPSIERVVLASTQLVCELGYRPRDDTDYRPTTVYGQSKVLSERLLRAAEDLGAGWAIVRPTSIWGPWFDAPYRQFFLSLARGWYVHPGGVRTRKQLGFVGNTVVQLEALLDAPLERIDRRTFYLADDEPIELRAFADCVRSHLGLRPTRSVSPVLLQAVARGGDLLERMGWRNPPLTSRRYRNIVTDELQDITPLRELSGPLPFSVDEGIELTLAWLRASGSGLPVR